MKKEAKDLKEKRVEQVKEQWIWDVLNCDLYIQIIYYHSNKIRRDIDNYGKLVLDCMSGIVYNDDVQIVKMLLKKEIDKKNPRVDIYVQKVKDE